MNAVLAGLGKLFSRADAGISVPAMDGVFKPNNRLEEAQRLVRLEGIDSLAACDTELFASSGTRLVRIALQNGTAAAEELRAFPAPITFLACTTGGRIAVGIAGSGVSLGGPEGWSDCALPDDMAAAMTAAVFLPDGRLALCLGSRSNATDAWKRDLMEQGRSGRVILLDPASGKTRLLAEGLAYPNGIALLADGALAVSESWRHRVLALPAEGPGPSRVLLDDLPAYPARLAAAGDGGFWLALFAPRRQLFELVLREDDYRQEMMATIEPDEWVGPALAATLGPAHPLQQGSVRQMGILKPWAPSRSYGLVLRCDAAFRPVESLHSRADGTLHGITAVCQAGERVFAASRGAGWLLGFPAEGGGPAA